MAPPTSSDTPFQLSEVLSPVAARAPIKATVLPLSKKLADPARKIHADLRRHFNTFYDDAGNIGRRYRRQDEIGGTPAVIAQRLGRGSVILFADNPTFRATFRGTERMFMNAVFFSGLINRSFGDY